MHIRWNAPVDVSKAASRRLVFGQVESGDETVVVSVESKTTGGGENGRRSGMDGRASSGNVNSKQVEEALLAGDSQHPNQAL